MRANADGRHKAWLQGRKDLTERVERGLWAAPVQIVARRLGLTEEEVRDLCPDMFDDEAEEEPGDGGY